MSPADPVQITLAEAADVTEIDRLLPFLASFEVPAGRNPRDLWEGDAQILKEWAEGSRPECFVHVAKDDEGRLLGVSMISMRDELLSHNPSAHLEIIVVAGTAQRRGVASKLLQAAEGAARDQGAKSISLHVFSSNKKARALYEKAGYDGELVRYIKTFTSDALL